MCYAVQAQAFACYAAGVESQQIQMQGRDFQFCDSDEAAQPAAPEDAQRTTSGTQGVPPD
eukprot:1024616-Amphidinium_carterae.1